MMGAKNDNAPLPVFNQYGGSYLKKSAAPRPPVISHNIDNEFNGFKYGDLKFF